MNETSRVRLDAALRWLIEEGHLTPLGRRQLQKILDEEGIT